MKQPPASQSASNRQDRPDKEPPFEQYSRHAAWNLLTGCFSPFIHDEYESDAKPHGKGHKHS